MNLMRTSLLPFAVIALLQVLGDFGFASGSERGYDLEREIEWASSTWPKTFGTVHFISPVSSLMAWVPNGKAIRVYAYSPDHICRPVELMRDSDRESDPSGPTWLTGKIYLRYGRTTRGHSLAFIGRQFSYQPNYYLEEKKGPDGKWHEQGTSAGPGGGVVYGILSYADDRIARFGGQPLFIHPICDGPLEWLPCPGGGERPCDRCENVGVELTEGAMRSVVVLGSGNRRATCNERCPLYPDNPTEARLYELAKHVSVWRERGDSVSEMPSLYKSLKDCHHEHPMRRSGGAAQQGVAPDDRSPAAPARR
jgi:hypothetical protein